MECQSDRLRPKLRQSDLQTFGVEVLLVVGRELSFELGLYVHKLSHSEVDDGRCFLFWRISDLQTLVIRVQYVPSFVEHFDVHCLVLLHSLDEPPFNRVLVYDNLPLALSTHFKPIF